MSLTTTRPCCAAPTILFRILFSLKSLNICVYINDRSAPILQKPIKTSDAIGKSFLTLFAKDTVRGWDVSTLPPFRIKSAAVVMREHGCGVVEVDSVIDAVNNYLVLDITSIIYKVESYAIDVDAAPPNSASCERVFSLPKLMFGDQQISTLADTIRSALMLRYNDRMVG